MTLATLKTWFDAHYHWCMSLVRIYLGVGLFWKGVSFLANKEELVGLMVDHDVAFAVGAMTHFIIMGHIFGGLLMAIGFATRIGALIQVPILGGAVFLIHWAGGIFAVAEELRFSAFVLFLLLIFVWYGSGALSLDAYLRGKKVS